MNVTLPWPDRRLSPNARLHWRAKAQAVKQARWDASYAVLQAANGSLNEWRRAVVDQTRIPLKVKFYPPDARWRDDDNMVGSFKNYRDGVADALSIDDRRFAAEYHFCEPEKPGRVEVVVG
jgi:crossover junction endodeoxyribonuclease RusA